MRIVVFGWGNESRGDDALGPLLLRRVEAAFADVVAVEDYQLQIEHALDLDGADLALFVDAARTGGAPFDFSETLPRADLTHSTHALPPEAVLDVFKRLNQRDPPPAFTLAVRGENFELGEGLSAAGAERLEAAWGFVEGLMRERSVEAWRAKAVARGA